MPISISGIKSVAMGKGYVRSSHYEVLLIPPRPTGSVVQTFLFRCENVTLPGAAWMSVDNHKPYASGKSYTIPYAYNPQEISLTTTVDGQGDFLQAMYEWTDAIVDIKGQEKFSAKYLKDYIAPYFAIRVYAEDQKTLIKTYDIKEAFPLTIDQIQMSWGDFDSTLKINVSFKFTNYIVS